MTHIKQAVIFIIFLAFAPPATAAQWEYDFTWAGIPVGHITWTVNEKGDRYTARTDVETTGLVALFSRHLSHTQVTGRIGAQAYHPQQYQTRYQTRGKKRSIDLTYGPGGEIVQEISLPASDVARETRELQPSQKNGLPDALSAMMILRRSVAEHGQEAGYSHTQRIYDGRNVTDVIWRIEGAEMIKIKGKKRDVIHTTLTRAAVAGYKPKELKKMKKGEATLHLYFSADDAAIPLMLSVSAPPGTLHGELARDCGTEKCAAPARMEDIAQVWKAAEKTP